MEGKLKNFEKLKEANSFNSQVFIIKKNTLSKHEENKIFETQTLYNLQHLDLENLKNKVNKIIINLK